MTYRGALDIIQDLQDAKTRASREGRPSNASDRELVETLTSELEAFTRRRWGMDANEYLAKLQRLRANRDADFRARHFADPEVQKAIRAQKRVA